MADSKANGFVAQADYPLAFSGRVVSVRTLASKQSGREFGVISISGSLVDPSTGAEMLFLPSYDVLVDADVADAVRPGHCQTPARLEVRQGRDGRFAIALSLCWQ